MTQISESTIRCRTCSGFHLRAQLSLDGIVAVECRSDGVLLSGLSFSVLVFRRHSILTVNVAVSVTLAQDSVQVNVSISGVLPTRCPKESALLCARREQSLVIEGLRSRCNRRPTCVRCSSEDCTLVCTYSGWADIGRCSAHATVCIVSSSRSQTEFGIPVTRFQFSPQSLFESQKVTESA